MFLTVKIVAILLILVGLVFLYIWIDANILAKRSSQSNPTTLKNYGYEAPTDVFTTPYFEFEAPDSWDFMDKVSTRYKFVYHNIRNKLVRGVITIYVDTAPDEEHARAPRLLPATIDKDFQLHPDTTVSEHCNKTAPGKDRVGESVFKFKGITFPCDNDATWYSVLVGLKGKSTMMKIKRPNGKEATYVINYYNSSSELNGREFLDALQNFKIR